MIHWTIEVVTNGTNTTHNLKTGESLTFGRMPLRGRPPDIAFPSKLIYASRRQGQLFVNSDGHLLFRTPRFEQALAYQRLSNHASPLQSDSNYPQQIDDTVVVYENLPTQSTFSCIAHVQRLHKQKPFENVDQNDRGNFEHFNIFENDRGNFEHFNIFENDRGNFEHFNIFENDWGNFEHFNIFENDWGNNSAEEQNDTQPEPTMTLQQHKVFTERVSETPIAMFTRKRLREQCGVANHTRSKKSRSN